MDSVKNSEDGVDLSSEEEVKKQVECFEKLLKSGLVDQVDMIDKEHKEAAEWLREIIKK